MTEDIMKVRTVLEQSSDAEVLPETSVATSRSPWLTRPRPS